jgi:hypothetical protein
MTISAMSVAELVIIMFEILGDLELCSPEPGYALNRDDLQA